MYVCTCVYNLRFPVIPLHRVQLHMYIEKSTRDSYVVIWRQWQLLATPWSSPFDVISSAIVCTRHLVRAKEKRHQLVGGVAPGQMMRAGTRARTSIQVRMGTYILVHISIRCVCRITRNFKEQQWKVCSKRYRSTGKLNGIWLLVTVFAIIKGIWYAVPEYGERKKWMERYVKKGNPLKDNWCCKLSLINYH